MDLFAAIFGFTLFVVSLAITYHWGIKPDREKKQRIAKQLLADARRRQYGNLRQNSDRRDRPVSHT